MLIHTRNGENLYTGASLGILTICEASKDMLLNS